MPITNRLGAIACTLALLARTSPASACDLATPPTLVIAANPADTTPPSTATVDVAKVRGGRDGGCRSGHGDCSDLTYVDFEVAASDDVSTSDAIGYAFETEPPNVLAGSGPIVPDAAGRIRLWLNGTSQATGPDVDVRVFAVDRAGNVSAQPALVTIDRSGGGCRLATRLDEGAPWLVAAIALLARSRSRRVTRRER